ncbi:uncharacterized protein EMH_0093280 [Eimeria mitis]|uniref:Uncharacterized protein n=1 Tax=Eimeria mitis TaxID=44415 RepID=U6KMH6_9EIME|nr:uncharacterized protein EMH_0093280 [Eimeria mitis]CDJ36658.1 hypothetical protein EMH_0093280 [Eimeria mitis]
MRKTRKRTKAMMVGEMAHGQLELEHQGIRKKAERALPLVLQGEARQRQPRDLDAPRKKMKERKRRMVGVIAHGPLQGVCREVVVPLDLALAAAKAPGVAARVKGQKRRRKAVIRNRKVLPMVLLLRTHVQAGGLLGVKEEETPRRREDQHGDLLLQAEAVEEKERKEKIERLLLKLSPTARAICVNCELL